MQKEQTEKKGKKKEKEQGKGKRRERERKINGLGTVAMVHVVTNTYCMTAGTV